MVVSSDGNLADTSLQVTLLRRSNNCRKSRVPIVSKKLNMVI